LIRYNNIVFHLKVKKKNIVDFILFKKYNNSFIREAKMYRYDLKGHRDRGRMVIGFTTICAINPYHH